MRTNSIISFTTVVLTFLYFSAVGQNDPQAKKILDKLSSKTKAYTSIKADFDFTIENKDKKKSTQSGKIITKGSKYKLEIPGHVIYCDGKTVWDYIKDAQEVQVKDVEVGEDVVNPSTIFTLYETGFKSKLDKDEGKFQVVKLFPIQADKKKFHTVKLNIDKIKNEIASVIMQMKDGSTHTYIIKSFVPNANITDTDFTFNAKAYPGVSVEDLR